MNQYALTGASYPLIISGKEFAAYSFTDVDYRELDSYIQNKVIEVAMRALPADLPSDQKTEWQQSTIRAAAASGWGTAEGVRIMNTSDGYWRLGWQMVRKKSNISFDMFRQLCTEGDDVQTKDNFYAIDTTFVILNTDEEENKEGDEDKDADAEDASAKSKSGSVPITDKAVQADMCGDSSDDTAAAVDDVAG